MFTLCYGAQVARAQNALMAGLLERRPSVLELASRLVQEDQLYMQARQAIGEQPPSYIDPLGTQSNLNQAEHAVHQGDTQNTINTETSKINCKKLTAISGLLGLQICMKFCVWSSFEWDF